MKISNTMTTLEEINSILSETLVDLVEKRISHRQAKSVADIAKALSINITNLELKKRVEFLENALTIKRNN
jgi:hypothetical protein